MRSSCAKTSSVGDLEQIQITMTDNGPGLPSDAMRSIFDPFYVRVDDPQEFGLNLMATRIQDTDLESVDLSRMRVLANCSEAVTWLAQRRFTEAVARLQRTERNLFAVSLDLQRARTPAGQDVKRISGIILPDDDVAEIVVLLLQQRFEHSKMFLRQKSED